MAKRETVWVEASGGMGISKKTTPAFDLLYRQSILLALKEQGMLNETQYGRCMDSLSTARAGCGTEDGK